MKATNENKPARHYDDWNVEDDKLLSQKHSEYRKKYGRADIADKMCVELFDRSEKAIVARRRLIRAIEKYLEMND
ncbi:MAG: hypothetical protein J6K17_15150 [Oscillospiraceae bacterium]|nr:hypothetical protein [Oscillospiraceae bacterium]